MTSLHLVADAAGVPGLGERYTRPPSQDYVDVVRPMLPPDVDPDHLVWTNPEAVERFRGYPRVLRRLLAPAPP